MSILDEIFANAGEGILLTCSYLVVQTFTYPEARSAPELSTVASGSSAPLQYQRTLVTGAASFSSQVPLPPGSTDITISKEVVLGLGGGGGSYDVQVKVPASGSLVHVNGNFVPVPDPAPNSNIISGTFSLNYVENSKSIPLSVEVVLVIGNLFYQQPNRVGYPFR
jgi:hypothetical protein